MTSIKKSKAKLPQVLGDFFELTPINSNTNSYYKEVKVEFFGSPEKSTLSKASKPRWPKFNNDGLFFTPAFVIPEDLPVLSLVQQSLKTDYMNRVKATKEPETKDTQNSLVIAQPEEQKRCGVCKTTYECFQQHIDSNSHKENCKKSKYTKHIYDFCSQLFSNSQPQQPECQKILQIPRSPIIRKTSNPESYQSKLIEQVNLDCFSNPLPLQDHLMQEMNPKFNINDLEITPPVRRRRFY